MVGGWIASYVFILFFGLGAAAAAACCCCCPQHQYWRGERYRLLFLPSPSPLLLLSFASTAVAAVGKGYEFSFLVEVLLLLLIIFLVGCAAAAAAAAACAAYNISTEAERGTGYCFFLLRFCPLDRDASDVYCCFCSWLLLFLSFRLQCFGYGCTLRCCWDEMHAGKKNKGCTPAASAINTTKWDIYLYVPGTCTRLYFSFSVWWDIPTSAFFHSRAFCFRVNRLHN